MKPNSSKEANEVLETFLHKLKSELVSIKTTERLKVLMTILSHVCNHLMYVIIVMYVII